VSYAGLAERAATAAARLDALGVGPDDVVAVISRNRVETLALVFAVRLAGAALAPISHRLAHERVEALCERLGARVVLHEPATRDSVRGLDQARSFAAFEGVAPAETVPDRADDGDPLCYLHDERGERVAGFAGRAVECNAATVAAAWGLGRADATSLVRPLSSPAGLLQVALPLLYAGGTLVCHRAFDAAAVVDELDRFDATHVVGSGLELSRLVAEPAFDGAVRGLDWVASAEALDPETRRSFETRGVPVVRTYGRVVAGPNGCCLPPVWRRAPDDPDHVGVPFPDCEVRLLDDDGAVVAGEGDGALSVRGPVTARWLVDETGKRRAVKGWRPTGDRARRLADGSYVRLPETE